jgi:hypothetical protein
MVRFRRDVIILDILGALMNGSNGIICAMAKKQVGSVSDGKGLGGVFLALGKPACEYPFGVDDHQLKYDARGFRPEMR